MCVHLVVTTVIMSSATVLMQILCALIHYAVCVTAHQCTHSEG